VAQKPANPRTVAERHRSTSTTLAAGATKRRPRLRHDGDGRTGSAGHAIVEFGLDEMFRQIQWEPGLEPSSHSDPYDAPVRSKDGAAKWVIVSATAVSDPTGSTGETLVMLTDLTERKQAEESLTRQAMHDGRGAACGMGLRRGPGIFDRAPDDQ